LRQVEHRHGGAPGLSAVCAAALSAAATIGEFLRGKPEADISGAYLMSGMQ
jgi:hypothetical protein